MMRPSMFRKTRRRTGEIDLRKEFDKFIFGDSENIPHGRLFLIRRMRRDNDGQPIYCVCAKASNTIEPNRDCSYCLGEGYLWDEEWIMGYGHFTDSGASPTWMAPGEVRAEYKVFYFRYDSNIKYGDKIVEVRLDTEGRPVIPYVRATIFKPKTISEHRSDYGRLEYYSVSCREDDAVRLDIPA